MMTDFYQNRNVVVLGGAGFVGRHLCHALENCGAIVSFVDNLSRLGYVNPTDTPAIHQYHDIIDNPGIYRYCDITGDNFWALMERLNPFAVFNLAAAVAGVEYNQKHQNQMFLDNINLQTIPVTVCDRLQTPHFLQVSSVCVYGEDANNPAVENNLGGEPTGANAGYAWAKRMGERAIQWSNLPHAVIVRPSNIFGPGDWYDDKAHVIPKLIKGQLEGTAQYFASTVRREFLYVEDAADGMVAAMEFGKHKEAYNLGTGGLTSISIGELHKEIARLTETSLPPESEAPFDTGDRNRYSNTLKINQFWHSRFGLYNGLSRTVKDYLCKS